MRNTPSFFKIDSFIWAVLLISQPLFMAVPYNNDTPWKEKGFAFAYQVASKLTDPICCAHQLYRQTFIIDVLHPEESKLEKGLRKGLLILESAVHSFFSLFTTVPGMEIRFIAHLLQNKPYIYFAGEAEEKQLADTSISLLSWNLCCVSGGYSITDGGVLPWPYRMPQLTSALLAQDADIVCLYEIFDIQTALRLFQGLKNIYSHFYFNINPNPVGLSSGLYIASKVKLVDPEFISFPKPSFDGRAKHCKKGFFSFDVQKDQKSFARIYMTHLQHSEVPKNPTEGEVNARRQAMSLILTHMQKFNDRVCVLTGDLNLEEKEYQISGWKNIFEQGVIEGLGCTWGGDQFCSGLTDKPFSSPLNLDYTMVMKNSCAMIRTSYIETGFEGTSFNPEAISDHKGLLSIINFGNFH